MSIRKKMAHGALWLLLEKAAQQLMAFAVFAVIARLIGPEEYGLVAFAYIAIAIATNIMNSFADGVVSLHIKDDARLSSLFWMVLACGVLLSSLCFWGADGFAMALGHARLALLLKQMALLPVLLSVAVIPTALITEAMDFRVFAKRTLVATLTGGAVGLYFAFKGWGASALIFQQMVTAVTVNLVVWSSCAWRPRAIFNYPVLSKTLKLGLSQTGSSFTTMLQQQIPRLLLGFTLGPLAVGQYVFALRLSSVLQELAFQPLLQVVYPAFAQIAEDQKAQKEILGQLILLLAFVFFPVIGGAIVTAPVLVPLLFGNAWASSVPLAQMFFGITLITATSTIIRDLFRAQKLTKEFLKIQIVAVLFEVGLAAVTVRFGLMAFACGCLAAASLALVLYTQQAKRWLHFQLWRSYATAWGPLVAMGAMMLACVVFLRDQTVVHNQVVLLLVEIGLGILVYALACLALQYNRIKRIVTFARAALARRSASAADLMQND